MTPREKLQEAIWDEMPDGMRARVFTWANVEGPGKAVPLELKYTAIGGRWVAPRDRVDPLRFTYDARALVPDLDCSVTRAVLFMGNTSQALRQLTRETLKRT